MLSNPTTHVRRVMVVAFILLAAGGVRAATPGITYDREERILQVLGFDADQPATLAALYEADQAAGWNVIRPLPEGDGYRMRASLWIGDASGVSTYFSLGDEKTPGEQLHIAGDIWVRPAAARAVNRLTAGIPDQPEARPLLGIHCEEPEQYGLIVGSREVQRGEMILFHTDLHPLDQPLRGGFSSRGPGGWYGNRVELTGCHIRGVASRATYGTSFRNSVKNNVLFEDCEWVFSLGDRVVNGIVMRGNQLALDRALGTYIDCRLENNQQDIVWQPRGTIFWVDSGTGKAGPPPDRDKVLAAEPDEPVEGREVLTEYRRVVFEVSGADGQAVSGAVLEVESFPADTMAVQAVPPIVTDARGRTPEDLMMDALLLVRARWYRGEDGDITRLPYRYRVCVKTPEGEIKVFKLDDVDLGRPGIRTVSMAAAVEP